MEGKVKHQERENNDQIKQDNEEIEKVDKMDLIDPNIENFKPMSKLQLTNIKLNQYLVIYLSF